MTAHQIEQLTALKGKKKYNGEIYDFTHFKELSNGTNIVVYAKSRTFNLLHSEVEDFLNSIEEIKEVTKFEVTPPPPPVVVTFPIPSENIEVKKTLLDTLKSLGENPTKEMIDQSNAIVNVANAMINLQKTEIQVYNIQKRINRN